MAAFWLRRSLVAPHATCSDSKRTIHAPSPCYSLASRTWSSPPHHFRAFHITPLYFGGACSSRPRRMTVHPIQTQGMEGMLSASCRGKILDMEMIASPFKATERPGPLEASFRRAIHCDRQRHRTKAVHAYTLPGSWARGQVNTRAPPSSPENAHLESLASKIHTLSRVRYRCSVGHHHSILFISHFMGRDSERTVQFHTSSNLLAPRPNSGPVSNQKK